MKPRTLEVVNNFLAVIWDDEHESFYEFEGLRRQCPCAVCRGETNVLSRSVPPPKTYTADCFEMKSWEYVGGYAVQPHWKDGHASGIYSYQYLRDLCSCDRCEAARKEKKTA